MREKKLTNVRNTGAEEKVHLSPPRVFTLEDAIGTNRNGVHGAMAVGVLLRVCLQCNLVVVYTHLGLVAGYVAEDELIEVTPSKIRYFLSLLL